MERRFTIALLLGSVLALLGLMLLFPTGPRERVVLAGNLERPQEIEGLLEEDAAPMSSRPPLRHYTDSVNRSLFASEPSPTVTRRQKPVPVAVAPRADPPAESNPFDGFVYRGIARIGPAVLALIEDARTGNGRFVRIGERFGGGRVDAINPQRVIVQIQGRERHLARSQKYSLTPLSKSADFLTAKPATPAATAGAGPPAAAPSQPQASPATTPALQSPVSATATAPVQATVGEAQVTVGETLQSLTPVQSPASQP